MNFELTRFNQVETLKKLRIIITAVLLLLTSSAQATYTCTGQVSGIVIDPKTGRLMVKTIAGISWPHLCSVSATYNGVDVDTCKQIYSLLLTAEISKKDVTMWFDDDTQRGSCESHAPWTLLSGWYFGPMMNN